MSQLKLFRPSPELTSSEAPDPRPLIYSISAFRLPVRSASQQVTLSRARAIHANRSCRQCGRTTVVPLEFEDAASNGRLMPSHGIATLAGFACHGCGARWGLEPESVDA
jgi:hypothetical protein